MTNNTGTAILNRLIKPENDDLSVDAAQPLARLDFPQCDHVRMDELSATGPWLQGKTAIGRATTAVLAINHPSAVAVRQALIDEGQFVSFPG